MTTPTASQFAAYQAMFDHFNARLFGGALDHVVCGDCDETLVAEDGGGDETESDDD